MPFLLALECVLALLLILINHYLHSFTLVTLKRNTYVRRALLRVLSLIPPVSLVNMPTALTALLRSALLAAIPMSWATLFLNAPRR